MNNNEFVMKEIRITVIQFDGRLDERKIPSFRGAVMAYADNDSLYHNHTEDAGFQLSLYQQV